MLALIVALFWLAILVPWGLVKFRNSRSEKSIESFHAEHEVLSRQAYSVAPAHRLSEVYPNEPQAYETTHDFTRGRPHLTVVQDDDTYSTLEGRSSWDEWDRDYDYDQPRTRAISAPQTQHRYAAYASAPAAAIASPQYQPEHRDGAPRRGSSMRVRRTRILTSLGLSAVATTVLNFLVGLSLLQYVAVLSWVALVAYVATALFAVSVGYLEISSLLGRRTTRAYTTRDDYGTEPEDDEIDYDERVVASGYYEPVYDNDLHRGSRRFALG